jgi:hypothetical protein
MFLAIPILAIVKIIFDKIDSLEPWGYLMGDNLPKKFIWRHNKKRQKNLEQVENDNIEDSSPTSTSIHIATESDKMQ